MILSAIIQAMLVAQVVPPATNFPEVEPAATAAGALTPQAQGDPQAVASRLSQDADAAAQPDAPPASLPASESADDTGIVVTARHKSAADPLAQINAKAFAVTETVDDNVTAPLARAYEHTMPSPVRAGLRNFLFNLHEPVVFVNFVLQHKIGKAAETFARFALDSTVGMAGLLDVAKRRPHVDIRLNHAGHGDHDDRAAARRARHALPQRDLDGSDRGAAHAQQADRV